MAWVAKLSELDLEGKVCGFKRKSFGFCVTMNPDYQSRNELPENLKSLLRPIYMLLPNSELIAEVLLISQGFSQSQKLAAKVVALYRLCEQQLISQKNYDFGLRALKSVLLGLKPRELCTNTNEEFSLVVAVKRANLGKLLPKDAELFLALLRDVFPGCEESEEELQEQRNSLKTLHSAAFESMCLPYNAHFSEIVHYIHSLLQLRLGIILLGPSQTGKSTALKLLSVLEDAHISAINPKSLALSQLFGYVARSGEWNEGVASFLIKAAGAKAAESSRKHWVLFDGPIESSWIENLNSVLDDNRTLCLANSERVRISDNLRLFFEADQLERSSPATISRCGIAYFPTYQELWVLVLETWAQDLQRFEEGLKGVDRGTAEIIKELGLKFLGEGLENLKQFVEREDAGVVCVKGVCSIFEVILLREEVDLEGENVRRRLSYIWAYAFLWGACAVFGIPANKVLFIVYNKNGEN